MRIFPRSIVPHPPVYVDGEGQRYALAFAKSTQWLSFWLTLLGWLLVVAGATLAIAGSVLGSTSEPDPTNLMGIVRAHPGLACSTLAIVLAGAGWQVLDRGSAATRASSVATTAVMVSTDRSTAQAESPDRLAYEACVQAKSLWLEGRMSHDRLEGIVTSLRRPGTQDGADPNATPKPRAGAADDSK